MAGSLESRTITVPSIVSYYTDEELNSEYHAKAEYEQAIEKYGAIYKILDLNNADMSAADLQAWTREWIRKHYFDGVLSFTVKGVDLHLLGFNKDKLCVGDRIPVEFLDVYKTPVTKVLTCISANYDILNPGNSTYKIGIPDVSMDVKLPNKNRGSSVGKKSSSYSSSGSAGSSSLYKYYKETDNKATINANDIEFLMQNLNSVLKDGEISAETLNVTTDNLSIVSTAVKGIQESAVIQNGTEIVHVVGAFDVKDNYYGDWPQWIPGQAYSVGARVRNGDDGYICIQDVPEGSGITINNTAYWQRQSGRKGVEFKEGAAAILDDINGQQVTVGAKIGEYDKNIDDLQQHVEMFEGSALWTQRDQITGVTGEYEVQTDPITGEKTLIIKSGGGIKIRKDSTEYGLFDEDSLTGGVMVDKINRTNWAEYVEGIQYMPGDQVTYDGKGYICKVRTKGAFDPTCWKESPIVRTQIKGDVIDIDASQVHIGSTTNVQAWMNTTDIWKGDTDIEIEDFHGFMADQGIVNELYANNFTAVNAEISNIKTDYLKTSTLKSNIGLLDDVVVKQLHGNLLVGGDVRITYHESQTGHDNQASLWDYPYEMEIIPDPDHANQYLFHYRKFGNAEWIPAGTFEHAVTVSGNWNGESSTVPVPYYEVLGANNTLKTYAYLEIETGGYSVNPNTKINAKLYHDSVASTNQLAVKEMTLEENTSSKFVELYIGDKTAGTNIRKGYISTAATYNAGWTYGQTQITRTTRAATSQELTIKTLDYDERFTIVDTYKKPNGSTSEIKYIVAAKTDRYSSGVTAGKNAVTINKGSWSGGQISFTKSEGTESTKTVQLCKTSASWSGNTATVQIWDGTSADAQHGVNTGYSVTVDASGRYTTGYRAGSQAVGWSTSWSNGFPYTSGDHNKLTVATTGRVNSSGNPDNFSGSWDVYVTSDNNVAYARLSSASGNVLAQLTHNKYSSGVTAGKNAVTINKGSWSGGQISFTKSEGTASTQSISLCKTTASWSGNTATVQIWDGTSADAQHGVNTGYSVTVDASGRYNVGVTDGVNSVTVSDVSVYGSPSADATSISVIGTASNGATKIGSIGITTQRTNAYNSGKTDGKNAITITKGNWDSGRISFTKSEGTESTKSVQLCATGVSWDGNVGTVQIWDGESADIYHGSYTGYTVTVTHPYPAAGDFSISAPPSISPSYTAGGTQLTSWVSVVRNAVTNSRYLYFDVWINQNTGTKKRYYMKF